MTHVAEFEKARFAQKLLKFSSKMGTSGRLNIAIIRNENCFVHMKMAHGVVLCHIILRVTYLYEGQACANCNLSSYFKVR